MPLPPKGDPRRPLQLAIRSIRLLGIVQLVYGLIMLVPAIMLVLMRSQGPALLAVSLVAFLVLALAVLFLIVASALKRRREWAATTGIVLASFEALLGLLGLVGNIFKFNPLSTVVLLLVVAAMAQLIYHLSQSYAAMRLADGEPVYGFEPILQTSNLPKTTGNP